jgi:propanediol dehydratase small subunit
MNLNLEFNQAAFTHNITEEDIRFAISTARYDAVIDEDESGNKHIIIGFDRNANLLKIMYNVLMKILSMFFMR